MICPYCGGPMIPRPSEKQKMAESKIAETVYRTPKRIQRLAYLREHGEQYVCQNKIQRACRLIGTYGGLKANDNSDSMQ